MDSIEDQPNDNDAPNNSHIQSLEENKDDEVNRGLSRTRSS